MEWDTAFSANPMIAILRDLASDREEDVATMFGEEIVVGAGAVLTPDGATIVIGAAGV